MQPSPLSLISENHTCVRLIPKIARCSNCRRFERSEPIESIDWSDERLIEHVSLAHPNSSPAVAAAAATPPLTRRLEMPPAAVDEHNRGVTRLSPLSDTNESSRRRRRANERTSERASARARSRQAAC